MRDAHEEERVCEKHKDRVSVCLLDCESSFRFQVPVLDARTDRDVGFVRGRGRQLDSIVTYRSESERVHLRVVASRVSEGFLEFHREEEGWVDCEGLS